MKKKSKGVSLKSMQRWGTLDKPFHAAMAADKVWMTKDGKEIPYRELTDDHLAAILKMLETEKTNRHAHLTGIKEEVWRRASILGKVLYEVR
jgi:hypothetical protein